MSGVLPNPALVAPGPIGPTQPTAPANRTGAAEATSGPSFAEVLAKQTSAPTFSRHALQRLQ